MKKFGKILFIISVLLVSFQSGERANEQFKQEFLKQINLVRAKGCRCGKTYMQPVPPLTWNDTLAKAAAGHAVDMYKKKYFDHNSPNGKTMSDRAIKAGYNFEGYKSWAVAENIAYGQHSITEVMNGWLKSPGHCKNLMSPNYKEVGIAEYNQYWVQDFGGRVAFNIPSKSTK